MRRVLGLMVFILFLSSPQAFGGGKGAQWGYEGSTGPAHWGDLSKEFRLCKEGKSQSPVNIVNPVKERLPKIEFHYKSTPLSIINNGHTIKVNYTQGSYIIYNGRRYDLLQFHFHRPSENTVNGKHFDMEAHLVHKGDGGELLVVAIFLKEGKRHPLIQRLWQYIPEEIGHKKHYRDVRIDISSLLPNEKGYYFFSGSLTTPPCTEGVKWIVLKRPVEVSKDQVERFEGFYRMNARPVQPLNGRRIRESF